MLSVFKKFKKEINKEHFPVDLEKGLTSEQVKQRTDNKLVNKTKKHVTKSYARIIYENVFNFFNILLFCDTRQCVSRLCQNHVYEIWFIHAYD